MSRRRRRDVHRCCVFIHLAASLFCTTVAALSIVMPRRPIIFDESRCPHGWTPAGTAGTCVQLQFEPRRVTTAATECRQLGAQLVQLRLDNAGDAQAVLLELSHLINEAIDKGIAEFTWTIGRVLSEEDSKKQTRTRRVKPARRRRASSEDADLGVHFALRKKENSADLFDIVELSMHSIHPFICALSTLKRKALLYEQALLPTGAPRILDEPSRRTPYHHYATAPGQKALSHGANTTGEEIGAPNYFVRLPCRIVSKSVPRVRWFTTDHTEEIDVSVSQSRYLISGGTLYINTSESTNTVKSYYCTATNEYGTVRSATAVVRPVFMEPFHASRADVFPLSGVTTGSQRLGRVTSGGIIGAGARIECEAPRHYPKSYTFSWVYGASNEQFISVSERIFISMDGTLYFAYNIAEDANQYSCILVLPVTQSAQHGPFFRLILPQFHQSTAPPRQQPFAPRIDDYQPSVFPEFPLRGETVYIECFAYGYPLPSYKWHRADGLPMSRRHRVTNYGRVLCIDDVELSDAVRYKCTARNELGVASAEVQLTVRSLPAVLRPMSDTLVAHNETVVFYCDIHAGGEIGAARTRATVEWFHDGRPLALLLLSRADRKRIKVTKKELRIYRAQAHDAGVYQCLVSNDVGAASTSALLVVRNVPPTFHANVFPQRVFVVEGASVQLPCFYQARPRGRSNWRRVFDSKVTSEATSNIAETASTLLTLEDDTDAIAVLQLKNVDAADAGVYECIASNIDETASARVNVTVLTPAKMRVHVSGSEGSDANSSMEVNCEVEIDCSDEKHCPEALFNWKFNDVSIRRLAAADHEIVRINHSERTLAERELTPKRDAEFDLSALNTNGYIYSSLASRVVTKLDSFFAGESSNDLLVMEQPEAARNSADGTDDTFFYSPNIAHASSASRLYRSTLQLASTFSANRAGRFSCQTAFGVGGVAELAPPSLAGAMAVNLRAELLENDVAQSFDGEERDGISEFGYLTASLSWHQPMAAGQPVRANSLNIIGYDLEFRTARNRDWRRVHFVPSLNAATLQNTLIHGLEPNQRYQFRVRTKSAEVMAGPVSTPSNWLTTPKCAPLESVSSIRHTTFDDAHVLLEWDAVELDYSAGNHLRYNVTWNGSTGFGGSELLDGTSLLITLPVSSTVSSDDDNCVQVSVSVVPVNEIGAGKYSTNTVLYITNKGPRRRAHNARLSRVNSTHLNLTWEWRNVGACENVYGTYISCDEVRAVAAANNGGNVSKYRCWFRNMFDVIARASVNQSVPSHYTHWLVHGLRPDKAYRCRLTPFDRHGRWGASAASTISMTTGPAPQRAPDITYVRLKQTANNDFAVLLDWNAIPLNTSIDSSSSLLSAERNARDIISDTGYKIFVYVDETAERPAILSLSTAQLYDTMRPSARIDGLKRIFNYKVQVAGFNAGGIGPTSAPLPVRIGSALLAGEMSFSIRHAFTPSVTATALLLLVFFQHFLLYYIR